MLISMSIFPYLEVTCFQHKLMSIHKLTAHIWLSIVILFLQSSAHYFFPDDQAF